MLGCPVRNRDWILPKYLEHIYNLNFPKGNLSLCFIINDSTDKTFDLLIDFKRKNAREYGSILLVNMDLGQIEDKRTSAVRREIYKGLAELRNVLLDVANQENVDYLFSVDSDILVPQFALTSLILSKKDIVSGQIWNDPSKTFPNIMIKKDGKYIHYKNFPRESLFPCDVTGAVYLLKKEVIQNVRYAFHPLGEDVAFCENAQEKGFSIWCNSAVTCEHILRSEDYYVRSN